MSAVPPAETPADGPAAPNRRLGRPPRISRSRIAEAALEVGLSDLTMSAVADHLGVTVAALYHHVDNKDDLLRLAADRSATRLRTPHDTGQHWSVFLLQWAVYNRAVFASDPALLEQFLDGAISPEVVARGAEGVLAGLVQRGFTPIEAQEAYETVTALALGLAVAAIRDHRAAERGSPPPSEELRRLAEDDAEQLPVLHAASREPRPDPTERALDRLRTALAGIAVLRGDDRAETERLMAAADVDPG